MRRSPSAEAGDGGPTVADEYEDMSAFWSGFDGQQAGELTGSIWDPYESGERRRAERAVAERYGVEDCVLTGTGMLGVAVALMSQAIRVGHPLGATQGGAYFENAQLLSILTGFAAAGGGPRGGDGSAGPTVDLVEIVGNSSRFPLTMSWTPRQGAVIDNSLFSVSIGLTELEQLGGFDCLVVESVPKYLCRDVPGGLVYGGREAVEHAREVARGLGALLARRPSVVVAERIPSAADLADRLRRHAANAEAFAARLDLPPDRFEVVVPHLLARQGGFATACCSIVAVRPLGGAPQLQAAFTEWARRVKERRRHGAVRAGYGWPVTYGRAYGSDVLNTASGDAYVRVSVGLEPPAEIEAMADDLADVLLCGSRAA